MKNNRRLSLTRIVIAAMLSAISFIIALTFPQIPLDAFGASATLCFHVPIDIAMFIDPFTALLTVLGSSIAIFIRTGNVVVLARALSHLVYIMVGYAMIKKV